MEITISPADGVADNNNQCFAVMTAALAKVNRGYAGNLQWAGGAIALRTNGGGITRISAEIEVINIAHKGAGIVDGVRQKQASIPVYARMVEAIHEAWPTAKVTIGFITYRAKAVPPPAPKTVVTAPSVVVTPSQKAPPGSKDGMTPAEAAAAAQEVEQYLLERGWGMM